MKMKRIVSMLILALITSCTQPNVNVIMGTASPSKAPVNVQQSNNTIRPVENKPTVQVSPEPNKVVEKDTNLGVKINEYGTTPVVQVNPTPQPTPYYNSQPLPTPTPSTLYHDGMPVPSATSSNPVDFRDKPFGYYSDGDYGRKYPYSQVKDIPKNVNHGPISLIFKDEYKIRPKDYINNYSYYQKITYEGKMAFFNRKDFLDEFSSLDSIVLESKKRDLDKLNETLKKYNVSSFSFSIGIPESEEKELENELNNQKIYDNHDYDVNNAYSSYTINVKDADIYNLITDLRNNELVRQCNYENFIETSG